MDTGIADTSATHVSADTGYNGYSCIADTIVCAYLLKGGIRDCIHGSGCIHATPGLKLVFGPNLGLLCGGKSLA